MLSPLAFLTCLFFTGKGNPFFTGKGNPLEPLPARKVMIMSMSQLWLPGVLRGLALLLAILTLPAAASEARVLGVFPYLSPTQMVEQLRPLHDYLEETLGERLVLRSAPDFHRFVERKQHGEYDLVITAPHMGRLAQLRDGWQLVVMSGQQTATVILVSRDAPVQGLADLRGARLAVGSRPSVTYLQAEAALRQAGLYADRDFTVVETATFSNVIYTVLRGEATAGATPTLLWDEWVAINQEQRESLRELYRAAPPNPHSFLVMVPPATEAATLERLQAALLRFHERPEGQLFLKQSRFLSFIPPDEDAMARSDPFLHILLPPEPEPSER